MDFNNLETGRSGPRRGIPKSVFHPFDVSAGHLFRHVPDLRVGYGGRAKRWSRCLIAFRNVGIRRRAFRHSRAAVRSLSDRRAPLDAGDRPFQFDDAHDHFGSD